MNDKQNNFIYIKGAGLVNFAAVSEAYRCKYDENTTNKPYAIRFHGVSGQALHIEARFAFEDQRDDAFKEILDAIKPTVIGTNPQQYE